ncbi:hypothetical protein AB3S75_033459 [Citrus x aurantiifolia]
MGLGFRKDEDAKGKEKKSPLNNQPDIRICRFLDGEKRHSTSIKQHQEQSHTMPSEKLVMIAMNAALEDVYKKVFADSYQHGAPLSRGARKRRGDFDRMNRDQLIDIFLSKRNQDERFFRSLCADWMPTRVIDRWTGELRE